MLATRTRTSGAERMRRFRSRLRSRLIDILGAKCVECGSTENLELDHKERREWDVRAVYSNRRLRIYEQEIAAGKIQCLCKGCNVRKGTPGEPVDDGAGF